MTAFANTDKGAPVSDEDRAGELVPMDPAAGRSPKRKRPMGLTEHERRILLAELAEVAAELDVLNERAVGLAARLASRPRLIRPA